MSTRRLRIVACCAALVLWIAGASHAGPSAEEDGGIPFAEQDGETVRFPVRVPIEELHAAMSQRPVFDGVELDELPRREDEYLHRPTYRVFPPTHVPGLPESLPASTCAVTSGKLSLSDSEEYPVREGG